MELIKNIWFGVKSILIPDRVANWKVIILCVIGATTYWFFNSLNKSYTTTISYPVNILFDENKFIAVSSLPDKIQINITGGGWNLLRRTNWFNISPINIQLEDPLVSRLPGNSMRGTISDQLNELQLNFIVTDSLHLNIENKISRPLKLKIDSASISLGENYYLVSPISLSADSALFSGPESLINLLSDEFVVRIPGQEIKSDYSQTAKIESGAENLFTVDPLSIDVSFEVRKFTRISETLPATLLNFPRRRTWHVNDSTVTISFMVREDQPDFNPEAFEIILDLRRMAKADSTIQPIIRKFPPEALFINIESGRVKVFHE